MATHSSIFAWGIPWTEEPGRLQSLGLQSWTRLSDQTTKNNKNKIVALGPGLSSVCLISFIFIKILLGRYYITFSSIIPTLLFIPFIRKVREITCLKSFGKLSSGRDWGQEEKGMTEDEMAGWHH